MRMESWWIFNALLASSVNRCDSPSKILQDLPYLFLIHAIKGCGTLLFLAHALWGGCRADDMRMESWWMFNAPLASSVNCGSNYSLSKIALWSRIFGNRLPFSMWMSYVTLKLLQFRINVGYHIFDFVSSWELVFFQSAFLIVLLYGISYAVQVMSLRWNPFEFLINSHQWMFHMALLWWMHGHYKVINWLPIGVAREPIRVSSFQPWMVGVFLNPCPYIPPSPPGSYGRIHFWPQETLTASLYPFFLSGHQSLDSGAPCISSSLAPLPDLTISCTHPFLIGLYYFVLCRRLMSILLF